MYLICEATGKRSLLSREEAQYLILRYRVKKVNKITGKRIKHRQGKPAQRRAYECSYCKGFHLTKWTLQRFKKAPQHELE